MRKYVSSIVAITTIMAASLNNFQSFPKTNASSYRTSYKVYGDINNDKRIDTFDVISMREAISDGSTSHDLDFNHDDNVDAVDLSLLIDYVLGKNTLFDAYLYDDADEDFVCDMFEIAILQSNPDSNDTDGDTLTDFDEIVYSNTSPTNKNTRGVSVTDADDDADNDKLTNKEEIVAKTNPQVADSDYDDINDYDELKKYKSDPNNEDTDKDGIIDGDEIKLGLSPILEKTDGKTPDYQRTFENTIASSNELLAYVNTEDAPYEISVDIKSAGNMEKALSVKTGSFSNTSEDSQIIGKSVSLSYDEKLTVDSAKIYFKPKSIDENIENYMLFQFFPETNYLLPVKTKYTKDSAYVETNELGTFCLVNISDLIDSKESSSPKSSSTVKILSSNTKVGLDDIVWDYTLDETEVLFYIDISNCATNTIESTKQSILDFSEALFDHCNNAVIQIIGYDLYKTTSQRRVYYTDSKEEKILFNLDSVKEAIDRIETDADVNNNDLDQAIYDLKSSFTNDFFSPECRNKYIFITSDSDLSLTQNQIGYWYNGVPKDTKGILEDINSDGIHINTLFSDSLFNNDRAVKGIKYYKDVCDEYGFGVYSKSSTGYFGNTGYARVYSDAVIDIQSLPIMYTCSVSPTTIPSNVERHAFINSLPSSYDSSKVPTADSNGNINFKDAAVSVGAAELDKNGNIVFKNLYSTCDESNLTRNGYKQLTNDMKISQKLIWDSFQITPFSEKILYHDDDGDGIPNKYDLYSDEPFDDRFEIVDDYEHFPIMDFMIQSKLGTGNTKFDPEYGTPGKDGRALCYNRREPEPEDYYHYNFNRICAGATKIQLMDRVAGVAAGKGWVPMRNSGDFLQTYVFKTDMKCISTEDMCEIITTDRGNLFHYMENVNAMIELCEETLLENRQMGFSSNHEDKFKIACYANKNIENCPSSHYFNVDNSDAETTNEGKDWSFSIGDAFCGLVCSAVRSGNTYTMNYKIYLMDYYEWGYHVDGGDKELHMLHECGLAKEYPIYGVIENTITWEHGYRIMSPKEVKELVASSQKTTNEQIKEICAKIDKAVKAA